LTKLYIYVKINIYFRGVIAGENNFDNENKGCEALKNTLKIGKINGWEKPSKTKQKNHFQSERIRDAFKNNSSVKVIEAHVNEFERGGRKLRVASYCRVSTKEEEQVSSYETQVNYYQEYIQNNPDWEFAGIYADNGISGTSMKNRTSFLRMIEDCRQNKIDKIITKSVARFSRNSADCLNIARELRALKPPVTILFETDGIDTAQEGYEEPLSSAGVSAQNESLRKSRLINWSRRIRFSKGLVLFPTHSILGYDKDIYGKIVIVPKEAKIVRFIYKSYLNGKCTSEIAADLTKAEIPTVKGKKKWNTSAILSILRNEKYVGDALMQKTYTPDSLTHKSVKNIGQVKQYYKENNHIGIIERKDWNEVQNQLPQRLYKRSKKIKAEPKLKIKYVRNGNLQGFCVIDTDWNKKETEQFIKRINKERII
jgi:DNA invertase Pin-like site-specific DNA recombinase